MPKKILDLVRRHQRAAATLAKRSMIFKGRLRRILPPPGSHAVAEEDEGYDHEGDPNDDPDKSSSSSDDDDDDDATILTVGKNVASGAGRPWRR